MFGADRLRLNGDVMLEAFSIVRKLRLQPGRGCGF